MQSIIEILSEQGPFVDAIANFSVRSQQQQMAEAVNKALQERTDVLVEAGTGTGKTFAYLVPAMLSGLKVILSTATKNLQDQLFHKDIPLVRKTLNVPVTISLLKGRANYLCIYRLRQAFHEGSFRDKEDAITLREIHEWSDSTQSGDIAEMPTIAEGHMVWPAVTSTVDNCLGQDCDDYQQCFLVKARREAQAADVVVVNHHLLLADMMLREEGFAELLPGADVFIVDEAHQLPEIASHFFGLSISSNQFLELAYDAVNAYLSDINENRDLERLADKLIKCVHDYRLVFGRQHRRAASDQLNYIKGYKTVLNNLNLACMDLEQALKILSERSSGLEKCFKRCETLRRRLLLMSESESGDDIQWFEVHKRSVSLHRTPLVIADQFQASKAQLSANWIFTSATLTVSDSFDYYARQLGYEQIAAYSWASPFAYASQTLLYLPPDMPEPNHANYNASVLETAQQLITLSRGRAFILFTSHSALQNAARVLANKLSYPLLVQGDMPRDRLLQEFRKLGNAVLLGTSSFWQGVDVRGAALSCVIIDKLPFASPGDPVLQARLDVLKRQGVNAFMHYQLPTAVITLKQGVGRLIRDEDDRGVLAICDPRIKSKSYGKVFLQSIPEMPQTDALNDVARFFK